ncbi:MAG TPA: hypothetical protein VN283_14965 [Thiobacillus sp.]|nr:hypothetical protein [Thiobacillus sp.]
MKLNQFINWLFKSWGKLSDDRGSSPFTDLSPVDDADEEGNYTKALTFAFEKPRIKNIALTGPYGSGKSSIIQTFEKNNKNYKFLNISLASFKEEENVPVNTVLIERSILQQMLYGADANTLPYSRFKRITTPSQPLLKSLLLVLWAVAAFFLYRYRNEILPLESYSLIPLVDFVISIPVVIISDIYKASFGISFKKVSLMNAEIEADEPSENSILNRHLDEIIYFFQVTKYDVVVLEDLDRFNEPEIFVKLREINKLINDNNLNKTSRPIKFLYALKDDMFVHKNRAKFFDFIIPVVPIINRTNSLDKMQKRLKELDFEKSVNPQFLREVSFYIDDLRLIHNIFNEFVIYYEHLKSKSLDVTKLLAMMIYKNVYPNDFENLPYKKGALFRICDTRSDLRQQSIDHLKEQVDKLRSQIKLADTENLGSVHELISAYIGHIAITTASNNSLFGIVSGGTQFGFSQIKTIEQLEPIISEKNIQLIIHNQYNNRYLFPTGKSFSEIEEEINPNATFLSRVENIKNKSIQKKNELQKEILRLEKEIAEVPHKRFFEILQSSGIKLEKLIEDCNITDSELLTYLVREGYLDDNYYLYISTFHEGRLTKIDQDFILTIRNFKPANPNQKIDNPKEICANIREEDFEREYVLNATLIDYLLENEATNEKRIKSAMRYISKNFNQSDGFFTTYFYTGKYLDRLIRSLSLEWPDYAGTSAWFPEKGTEHLSYIFRFVEAEYVSEKMNKAKVLTKYLSEYGALVLASDLQLPDNYDFLKKLHVRFDDLPSLEANDALINFSCEESLYAINSQNVNFILARFADARSAVTLKPEKANYTSILAAGTKTLKDYVEQNLPDYIEKVVLALPDNSDESEEAILAIINHESIDDDLKKKIISKQNYVFETFERIPQSLWSHLLLEEKIAISWQNISKYFSHEDSDKAVLTNLFGRQNIVSSLSSRMISKSDIGEESSQSLSSFILKNNEINDSDYSKLIKCLPYQYIEFPTGISNEKIEILANEGKVILTEKTFVFAANANDNQLTAILISKNIDAFMQAKEKYLISDDVRELLLASEISQKNKITVSLDVTPSGAAKSKQLSRLIAGLLVSDEADCSEFDDTVLSSAIVNARTSADSIRLLMKCLSTWDENKAMAVLADLPEPFSEISVYGKRPRLDNNEMNLSFARLLETKGFISSVKVEDDLIKINTFKSSDHSD